MINRGAEMTHSEIALTQSATPPAEAPVIRTIAMPADANPYGDIFGGWLMSQMDLAASNVASRVARGRASTVRVEAMNFLRPGHVGGGGRLYARVFARRT